MFVLCTLVYPLVLVLLCTGTGLLVDRAGGSFLHPALLPAVGAAGLIGLSQLSTYGSLLAPTTPALMAAVAIAGFALCRTRAVELARRIAQRPWPAAAMALAYLLALAPVLLSGRATFSSFMALSDSAVHMIGADYLITHGQQYTHLDLHNSYGQFINAYYNTSYPSGADTLLGGSAFLLGLPIIWAFQPLNAFVLACAIGPAWVLARRVGLGVRTSAAAALTCVLPALVYGDVLIGSVKEITALMMILTLGAMLAGHRSWLGLAPRRSMPIGLVVAAGVSSLGVGFGVWAVMAALVLVVILAGEVISRTVRPARAAAGAGVAAVTILLAALPTWADAGGSLKVAGNIASTSNAGNLHEPLRPIQLLGVWLSGSYKIEPPASSLTATHLLALLTLACAAIGAVKLVRIRAYALACWIALMIIGWVLVEHTVTTWGSAKTLMITSPVIMLLAWAGVAAIRSLPGRAAPRLAAALVAGVILAGVLVSDALQYHASGLAPTARYTELASVNSRFAGRGPALFTDFDEYSMYVLRSLDVGGPDFVYPPAALASTSAGYGEPVDLDAASPEALRAYPLIITRRDPEEPRPPAAYRLLWQGSYYRVWGRAPGAAAALAHIPLTGSPSARCLRIAGLARSLPTGALAAAPAPTLVRVDLERTSRPRNWGHQRQSLVMAHPGTLTARFEIPFTGAWNLWVQGEFMPNVPLALDGRPLAPPGGQLSGNSLVGDTLPPIPLRLTAGSHVLTLTRPAATLAPGDGGAAVLEGIVLAPRSDAVDRLTVVPASSWRELCNHQSEWVELLAAPPGG
jgi:hypothetical protein